MGACYNRAPFVSPSASALAEQWRGSDRTGGGGAAEVGSRQDLTGGHAPHSYLAAQLFCAAVTSALAGLKCAELRVIGIAISAVKLQSTNGAAHGARHTAANASLGICRTPHLVGQLGVGCMQVGNLGGWQRPSLLVFAGSSAAVQAAAQNAQTGLCTTNGPT